MDEREQIVQEAVDRLIEQALQELGQSTKESDAEEILSHLVDQIRSDPMLSEESRNLMLDYIRHLNQITHTYSQHLYYQGIKDCVRLLRELGVLR